MKKSLFVFLAAAAACSPGIHVDEARSNLSRISNPNAPAADVAALVAGNTGFALELHRQLAAHGGNSVYSPYSISLDMAMVRWSLGASDRVGVGTTMGFGLPDAQLDPAFDALDLSLTSISGATSHGDDRQFRSGNALWSAGQPQQAYLDTLAQYYGAGVLLGPDPGAAIRAWQATQSTGSALPFMVAAPCDEAVVNLVGFDATWTLPFDASLTRSAAFRRQDGSVISAATMSQRVDLAVSTDGPAAVELPYSGDALTMLIVVPDDLAAFEASLTPSTLAQIDQRLSIQHVNLSLPKLNMQASSSVLNALQDLGLPLDSGHWQIWHSAELKLAEDGTQAAAMTTTTHTPSVVQEATPFAVDRPFFFVIRDRATRSILFAGRVTDPTAP